MTDARWFLLLGAANAALAVLLGAFGAHSLKTHLVADMMAVYQTGLQYHLFHALGLLAVGLAALHLSDSKWLRWSGWLMLAGIFIFSGSLYLLSITGLRWLGAVTPLGGITFIAAWVLFAVAIVKGRK
ncbi:MAG: DUF423 domain-containing protein [Gammaproteobacteria bacterium]|nr:DUF423 domain-containing protein [Gammaproteobacteria bacterium]